MVAAVFQVRKVQLCERLIHKCLRLRAGHAVIERAEEHILKHRRHEHLIVRVLQDIAQPPADVREVVTVHLQTVDRDRTGDGDEPQRRLHERGFTRAVGADQADLLALGNGKRQVI